MTKERLKGFYTLHTEVTTLEKRIKESSDSNGVDGMVNTAVKKRLQAQISRLAEKMQTELDAIMDFIESFDDSRDRLILTMRYIDGNTIKHTAMNIGFSESLINTRLCNILSDIPDK